MTEIPDKQAEKLENASEKTRWKPGQSGNPKGRPRKEFTLTSLVKEELEKVAADSPDGMTNAQLTAISLVNLAKQGNVKALELLLERVDGKVKQTIGNPDGEASKIDTTYEIAFDSALSSAISIPTDDESNIVL